MPDEIKVDDEVRFSIGVDGRGVVVEIVQRGSGVEYVIASKDKMRSVLWHPTAWYSHKHDCSTVWADEDCVWPVD